MSEQRADLAAGWSWRFELGVWALGLAMAVVILWPALLGDAVMCGVDTQSFARPQWQLMRQQLLSGGYSGWNPWQGPGSPWVGDLSAPLYYPPLVVLLLFVRALDALPLLTAFHWCLALAGALRLNRALGLSPTAGAAAALGFSFGGVGVSYALTPMYLGGQAWLPWALLALLRFVERPRLHPVIAGGAAFALMFLMGAVEVCIWTAALGLIYGWRAWGRGGRLVLGLAGMAAVAMLLSAVALAPALSIFAETHRSARLGAEGARWSLAPVELLGLFSPRLFHEGLPSSLVGGERPWFVSLYPGALLGLCAAAGLSKVFADRRAAGAALVLVLLLPLAFGRFSPLSEWTLALPILDRIRYPAKLFLPCWWALSVASGVGWDAWRRSGGWERPLGVAVGGYGLALVIVAALGPPSMTWRLGLPLLSLVVVSFSQARLAGAARGWVALAVLVLELSACAICTIPRAPRALFDGPPELAAALAAEGQGGVVRVTHLAKPLELSAVEGSEDFAAAINRDFGLRESMGLSAAMGYHVSSATPFTPLALERVASWSEDASEAGLGILSTQALGVTHLISTPEDELPAVGLFEEVASYGPLRLGRSRIAAPWAAVYGRVDAAASSEAARARVLSRSFDARDETVLEGLDAPILGEAGEVGVVRIRRQQPDVVELDCEVNAPGALVVRIPYARGWRATVDGAPADILPADSLHIGLVLEPGAHAVALRYEVRGREAGAMTSAAAWLVALLILGSGLSFARRSKRGSAASARPSPPPS